MSKYLVLCPDVYSFNAEDTGDLIRGGYLGCVAKVFKNTIGSAVFPL